MIINKDIIHQQSENLFINSEEKELQKYAYFGKFLVLTDFDDGWKYQMQKQLLAYLSSLKDKEINVSHTVDKNKGEILAILSTSELNENVEQEILDISTKIQKKFYMSEVLQKIGYGLSEGSSLPVGIENFRENDFGYERQAYQKLYIEIVLLEQKIKDTLKFIDASNDLNISDTNKVLLEQVKGLNESFSHELINKKELLSQIEVNLYSSLALKSILGKQAGTQLKKSSNTQSFVTGTGLVGNEVSSSIDEKSVDYTKNTEGKIGDCMYDTYGEVITARFLKTGKQIICNGDELKGLYLEGIENMPGLNSFAPLEVNDKGEVLVLCVSGNKREFFYYFINGKYKLLNIDGVQSIAAVREISADDNGHLLFGSCSITGYARDRQRFWLEDGEFRSLKIDLKNIQSSWGEVIDDNGKPICGYYKDKHYNRNYFWHEEGVMKTLKIEGFGMISEISKLDCDSQGKPLYGKCKVKERYMSLKFILDKQSGKYIKYSMLTENPYKDKKSQDLLVHQD